MSHSIENLKRINLRPTEWVTIKYREVNSYDTGQIATDFILPTQVAPIFNEQENTIFIKFPGQSHPSELDIDKIEYFLRSDTQPFTGWNTDQYWVATKKFGTLLKNHHYNILDCNGEILSIFFDRWRLDDKRILNVDATLTDGTKISLSQYQILDIL